MHPRQRTKVLAFAVAPCDPPFFKKKRFLLFFFEKKNQKTFIRWSGVPYCGSKADP
jgi:hypothetical protein